MKQSIRGPWPPIEDLIRGLGDADRHARCRAARGLGDRGDPRAVEPLLLALRDPSGDVRARAAVALGRLRDDRAIGPLIEAIGDAKGSVRSAASAAVRKFGRRADRPLLDLVGHPVAVNPDPLLYREAVRRSWPVRFFDPPPRLSIDAEDLASRV